MDNTTDILEYLYDNVFWEVHSWVKRINTVCDIKISVTRFKLPISGHDSMTAHGTKRNIVVCSLVKINPYASRQLIFNIALNDYSIVLNNCFIREILAETQNMKLYEAIEYIDMNYFIGSYPRIRELIDEEFYNVSTENIPRLLEAKNNYRTLSILDKLNL